MRSLRVIAAGVLILGLAACGRQDAKPGASAAASAAASAPISASAQSVQQADALLAAYRQMIVLMGDVKTLKPAEAARWYARAIEMDGSRSLAYLNLGDAYQQAGMDAKAIAAYTTFAVLAPKHSRSESLRAWIANPDPGHRPVLPAPAPAP